MYFELKTVYLENHDQDDEDHHHGGHQHVAHDQDWGRAGGGGHGLDGCGAITARVGDALVVTVGSSIPEKCKFFYERSEFVEGNYPGRTSFSSVGGAAVPSSLWTEAARPKTIRTRDSLKDNIVLFSSKVANRLSLWVMRPPGW